MLILPDISILFIFPGRLLDSSEDTATPHLSPRSVPHLLLGRHAAQGLPLLVVKCGSVTSFKYSVLTQTKGSEECEHKPDMAFAEKR